MTVAVITGAASGIGAGLARHAASLGMSLALADCDEAALKSLADTLSTNLIAVPTDVSKDAAVQSFAEAVYEKFGCVDLLFNNAGVLSGGLSWEIDAETWQRSVDINIGGVANVIRAFIPRMIAAERSGRIINTSSVGGFLTSPFMAPYTATKFAVVGMSETLAKDLNTVGSKVKVSLLAPGPVKTGILNRQEPAEISDFMTSLRTMTDKIGMTPDEFAPHVFDAIRRGEYWIIPQPERLDSGLRKRTEMILERRQPTVFRVEDIAEAKTDGSLNS